MRRWWGNSFDLVLSRSAARIDVTIDDDGAIEVVDDGPGLPAEGSAIEAAFSGFHDTPTADGHWPHVHLSFASGIGLGPVCAVSSEVEVEVHRDGARFEQTFSRGVATTPLVRTAVDEEVTGTRIRVRPDPDIFDDSRVSADRVAHLLEEIALLQPGLTTTLRLGTAPPIVVGPVVDLAPMFERTFGELPAFLPADGPILMSERGRDFWVDIALAWSGARSGFEVRSYGNFLPTARGGRHEDGLVEGLRRVFASSAALDPDTSLAGLRAIVHIGVANPVFSGPTMEHLDSPEALELVADTIATRLPEVLARTSGLSAALSREPDRPTTDGT